MTDPIVCREGICKYKYISYLDECIDCDIVQQIEHELLKESINGKN